MQNFEKWGAPTLRNWPLGNVTGCATSTSTHHRQLKGIVKEYLRGEGFLNDSVGWYLLL